MTYPTIQPHEVHPSHDMAEEGWLITDPFCQRCRLGAVESGERLREPCEPDAHRQTHANSIAVEGALGWQVAKVIAASALQTACESDPADPEHPDTICLSTEDFETIVRCAIENWRETNLPAAPGTTPAKVRIPYAYCCAEGGGRVEACDCVNKNHGFAYVDATPAKAVEGECTISQRDLLVRYFSKLKLSEKQDCAARMGIAEDVTLGGLERGKKFFMDVRAAGRLAELADLIDEFDPPATPSKPLAVEADEVERLLQLIETADEHGDECAIVEQAERIREAQRESGGQ